MNEAALIGVSVGIDLYIATLGWNVVRPVSALLLKVFRRRTSYKEFCWQCEVQSVLWGWENKVPGLFEPLASLLTDLSTRSRQFHHNIRCYNSVLCLAILQAN